MSAESFESYVAARGPSLLRFAAALTGDPHTAEHLVQVTLLSAQSTVTGRRELRLVLAHPDASGATPRDDAISGG